LRRSLFDSIQAEVSGSSWLDLFAGSGSFGIEALSRGARRAAFVENGPSGVACLQRNLQMLGVGEDRAQILRRRIPELFASPAPDGAPFDLVSMDPPFALSRDSAQLEAMLLGLQQALAGGWLSESVLLAWEEPSEAAAPAIPGLEEVDRRAFGISRLRIFRRR